MTEKLELTTQAPAQIEQRLSAHKKNIAAYAEGVRKSGAQLFGYAFLAGREMNLAAELLDHGKFTKWLTDNFPKLSHGTTHNWREFATNIGRALPDFGAGKSLQLKKTFSKTEQASILEVVPKILDGQGMMEFNRACRFLKEPELQGGLRMPVDDVQDYLREHHPELVGTAYADLPAKVKAEVRKAVLGKSRRKGAKDRIAEANEVIQTRIDFLNGWASESSRKTGGYLDACDRATVKELEEARLAYGRAIQAAMEKRK